MTKTEETYSNLNLVIYIRGITGNLMSHASIVLQDRVCWIISKGWIILFKCIKSCAHEHHQPTMLCTQCSTLQCSDVHKNRRPRVNICLANYTKKKTPYLRKQLSVHMGQHSQDGYCVKNWSYFV